MEALHDELSGLTYAALVGIRKQSVKDAERLFSLSLADFMDCKGYKAEAKYIRVVNGWRQACDKRGLSETKRSTLSNTFLDYILDDLMPWHKQMRDFSLLEVNRCVNCDSYQTTSDSPMYKLRCPVDLMFPMCFDTCK